MNTWIIYFLFIAFVISVAVNIRLFIVASDLHEDVVLSISNSKNLEAQSLNHLKSGNVEKAKNLLLNSVNNKTLYIGICIEEKCVNNKALSQISRNP